MNKHKGKVDPLTDFSKALDEQMALQNTDMFEPTGTQEDIITTIGNGLYNIVVIVSCNKYSGKTTTAANILKNMFWESDKEWFNYPVFNKWPYLDAMGNEIKNGRITGTVKNTSDNGPIRTEILKWWPKSRYTALKASKAYHSIYETDTGWGFDVLTYEQTPDEYEGPLLAWTWSDEPPKADLVGPITSRFMHGGLWIITATPIKCAPFLDVIDDLASKSGKVKYLSSPVWDNSIEEGKPNHKGRKKGLAPLSEIKAWADMQPRDQYDSRVLGKISKNEGKIYKDFDATYHEQRFDIESDHAKKWNCYCGFDPHRKYYPFIGWWALTPDETWICYNEWPTHQTLGAFYDEARNTIPCNLDPETISKIIKQFDMSQYGLTMITRFIDRRFARGTEVDWSKKTEGIITEYAQYGIDFQLPPAERIDPQREKIRELLRFNKSLVMTDHNRPSMFIMPHCVNTRRAFERHYWEEGSEKEAERYKDPIDVFRYILAGVGSESYREVNPLPNKGSNGRSNKIISRIDDYSEYMSDISMV